MHSHERAPLLSADRSLRPRHETWNELQKARARTLSRLLGRQSSEARELLRRQEARFGQLDRSYALPPRRRKRGLWGWLVRMLLGERKSRSELARDIGKLHPGSRWTRRERLSGQTSAFSVPDLLGMMSSSRRSGVLGLSLGEESVCFHLSGGRLVAGRSDNTPRGHRLGEILVGQGVLDREALLSVLARRKPFGGQLGESLLRHKLVTPEELRAGVREQYRRLLSRTQSAGDAAFVFQACDVADPADGLKLDIEALLLEAACAADEDAREEAPPAPERAARPRLQVPRLRAAR